MPNRNGRPLMVFLAITLQIAMLNRNGLKFQEVDRDAQCNGRPLMASKPYHIS